MEKTDSKYALGIYFDKVGVPTNLNNKKLFAEDYILSIICNLL